MYMNYFDSPGIQVFMGIGGFLLFWCAIVFVIGKLGGWGAIVHRFPYTGATAGGGNERKRFQSIKIGLSNYSGVVNFEALPQGLHMSTIFLFKFGHSDVLIPWEELCVESGKGLLHHMYQFSFVSLPHKSFSTMKGLGDWIIENKKQYRP